MGEGCGVGGGGDFQPPRSATFCMCRREKTQMLSLSTASAYSSPGEGRGARRLSPPRPADLEER